MPYFRVDDNFGNHPKVLAIPRRQRLACVGLWTLAGSWCARQLTDGRLGKHMLDEFGATEKHAELLVSTGLWTTDGDSYQFHDWATWQGWTREDVLAKREAEAERKRRWRESKANKRSAGHDGADDDVPDLSQRDNPRTDNGTTASVRPESALTHPLPIPSTTTTHPSLSYGEREDEWSSREGDVAEPNAHASNDPLPPEPPLCRKHIGWDRDAIPGCRPCGKLREQWETQLADADRPPPRPDWCGTCDETTRLLELDDRTVTRCPDCHPANALAGATP